MAPGADYIKSWSPPADLVVFASHLGQTAIVLEDLCGEPLDRFLSSKSHVPSDVLAGITAAEHKKVVVFCLECGR